MKKILLDTNFLLIPAQFKVDIFSEMERICNFNYKLFILDKTVEELENIIKSQKGKSKEAAKLALKLIESKGVKAIKTENNKNTDDALVEFCLKNKDSIVATQDKELKKKLREKKIPVIILRQKKRLMLYGAYLA